MDQAHIQPIDAPNPQTPNHGQHIIDRLRRGDLPQMVDWFDPGLLAKVGVRSVISATLGSYTDQRLIQAATDNATTEELQNRYNFSGDGVITDRDEPRPSEALASRPDGAVWIDYIADLGDGFEATYAMAYLLAADELKVAGVNAPLPAGELLLMGGDQVYPDATKQEYTDRLRDPYDWAFSTTDPKRKLFAIPGNHDWYDGLSAFSALFCSARDRIAKGVGTQIGGWRCHQHRSYFAIKLPHNWWLWGPDIQLADNLDDSQRDYFDLMAEQTKPGDNIILCLAEPSWLHKNYDNLHEISMLARKNGAKICAVLAGDWHHYSRYTSDQLGVQFITAGGGGAFAHATHGLKNRIALRWATPTGAPKSIASPTDSVAFNRSEKSVMGAGGPDFTQQLATKPANPVAEKFAQSLASNTVAPEPKPITDLDAGPGGIGRRAKAVRKEEIESPAYDCRAMSIYPPKSTSRLLCLKNLGLPFRNRPFTYLVGMIYFIFAWVFVVADPRQSPITRNMVQAINLEIDAASTGIKKIHDDIGDAERTLKTSSSATQKASLEENIAKLKADKEKKEAARKEIEARRDAVQGEADTNWANQLKSRLKAIGADEKLGLAGMVMAAASAMVGASLGYVLDMKAFATAAELSPMFAFMLLGLWAALVFYVESDSKIVQILIGTMHAAAHIVALLVVSWLAQATGYLPRLLFQAVGVPDDVVRILWGIFVTLFLGGLLGGFIMGLYWTLTSTLFNMHTGDAFGALGIKDYKNFLRIKLEPGRATIYPIALDKVPGRRGWRWQLAKGEPRPAHNPQVMPVKPLQPRLIEAAPIIIEASKIRG